MAAYIAAKREIVAHQQADDVAVLVDALWAELMAVQAETLTRYAAGQRYVWRQAAAALATDDEPRIELTADDVIVVTGGARGITARVARVQATGRSETRIAGATRVKFSGMSRSGAGV